MSIIKMIDGVKVVIFDNDHLPPHFHLISPAGEEMFIDCEVSVVKPIYQTRKILHQFTNCEQSVIDLSQAIKESKKGGKITKWKDFQKVSVGYCGGSIEWEDYEIGADTLRQMAD